MISVIPLANIGRISPGDDLRGMIVTALHEFVPLLDSDCLVVASKVVAKAMGRIEKIDASHTKTDIVERESRRIIRRRGDLIISETQHGFICANAGIDESNADPDTVVLLPDDCDAAAHGIRMRINAEYKQDCAVLISDTFGRPFRIGETNVALGYSGLTSFADLRGTRDYYDRELQVTTIAIADEIAGAAELVMHKSSGICAALVRGLPSSYRGDGRGTDLIRPAGEDLFR